jgi:predicted signal transduction protein with EAL and GGDEF domain
VARRIESRIRSIDVASRFGGDEFVVVCPEVHDPRDAVAVAERLQERLSEPFVVRGVEVTIGASIGIAITHAAADPATLLRQADTAAYRAKERGRNRWEIFDDELRESVARRLDVESGLRRALEHDELTLLYQPIVTLDSGEVHSFEALVRWDRPGHGLVPPADFLGVAEETGLIVALDRHVLTMACRQLAAWRDEGLTVPLLSVNLSARHLLHPELVDDLRRVLDESGVEPSRLCLELGESLLVRDAGAAMPVLRRVHDLGVGLAIDDFGTGYSSLSHLRGMPVAHVKLDRGFVLELGADAAGATIASSVIGLARALGMQVVAKSVETRDHVEIVAAFGCELAQGYLYSPPVAAADVPGLLEPGRLSVPGR